MNQDIFRDLDMDLIEFFQRGQFQDFLRTLPDYDHDRRHRRNEPYVKVIWLFNIFPLPVVQYKRIWRDFHLSQIAFRIFSVLATTVAKAFRVTTFIFAASFYLQGTLRRFFLFGNELTFSANFFRDILTFILRNNHSIFDRLAMIHGRSIFNTSDASILYNIKNTLVDMSLLQLDYKCDTSIQGAQQCFANNTSLIYKFNDILQSGDLISVSVYLLYALIGNLICLNVLYHYTISVFQRPRKWHNFNVNLISLVWKSIKDCM